MHSLVARRCARIRRAVLLCPVCSMQKHDSKIIGQRWLAARRLLGAQRETCLSVLFCSEDHLSFGVGVLYSPRHLSVALRPRSK